MPALRAGRDESRRPDGDGKVTREGGLRRVTGLWAGISDCGAALGCTARGGHWYRGLSRRPVCRSGSRGCAACSAPRGGMTPMWVGSEQSAEFLDAQAGTTPTSGRGEISSSVCATTLEIPHPRCGLRDDPDVRAGPGAHRGAPLRPHRAGPVLPYTSRNTSPSPITSGVEAPSGCQRISSCSVTGNCASGVHTSTTLASASTNQ